MVGGAGSGASTVKAKQKRESKISYVIYIIYQNGIVHLDHSTLNNIPHLLQSSPRPLPSVRLLPLPSSQPPPQSCKWCQVGGRSECGKCHCQQVG